VWLKRANNRAVSDIKAVLEQR